MIQYPSGMGLMNDWSCHYIWFPCIILVLWSFGPSGGSYRESLSNRDTQQIVNTLSYNLNIW